MQVYRRLGSLAALAAIAGCGIVGGGSKDVSQLTLRDPAWDRVNVEIVVTRRADCDSRAEGFISMREVVMRRKGQETVEVPNGATICWRRDRDPNAPAAGAWSGWTRASVPPGGSAEADL
jgi:hypothetical protein